jgi:hypothetical protein
LYRVFVLHKLNNINRCLQPTSVHILDGRVHKKFDKLGTFHKSEIHQFSELNLNTLGCKWLAMQTVFTDDIWFEMNARPED